MNLKFRMLLMYATFFQFLDRTVLDPSLFMACFLGRDGSSHQQALRQDAIAPIQ